MGRYLAIAGMGDVPQGGYPNTAVNYFVVDTQYKVVVADCGDSQSRAQEIANALNAAEPA